MFTINIYLRFALMAVLTIGGVIMAFTLGFWYAFPFLLAGIILIVGYIMLGTVQSAAALMQDSNFLEAEKRLGFTLKPNWLFKPNRAYYYMLQGTISSGLKKGNDVTAEYLKKADAIGFQTDNEKAMVSLQLIGIALQKGNWNVAKSQLKELKSLNITEPEIKEQLKQVEMAVKNRGAVRNARIQGGGQMQRGSKRRRPKMR